HVPAVTNQLTPFASARSNCATPSVGCAPSKDSPAADTQTCRFKIEGIRARGIPSIYLWLLRFACRGTGLLRLRRLAETTPRQPPACRPDQEPRVLHVARAQPPWLAKHAVRPFQV